MDRHRMQQHNSILTDDAVAELLAKEASEASIKYSSVGLEAFRSTKPSSKAKPNTRFLGRIIRETTSHNAALLAKEASEAQARLDDLTEVQERKRRRLNPSASDIRRRQMGDIFSILQSRKRNNGAERSDGPRQKDDGRDKGRSRESDRHHKRDDGRQEAPDEEHRSRRKNKDGTIDEHRRRHRRRSRSPPNRDRGYRGRSPLVSDDEDERPRRSEPHHRKSGKDHDLIGSESSKRRSYGRLCEDGDSFSSRSERSFPAEGVESDPLDEFIGPAPPSRSPVRTRGRGAIRGAAAMDSRFSEDYDPALDVEQLESAAADDWDEAVEAYRDRQKWKRQGAERLRAAGFTEDQIKKWEKGGEKDIDDVRWSKAGERRAWDMGKEDNVL
ncbi:hypothetical protein VTK56DRAFT_8631 [Thermocarpiscus australiensis]